MSPSEKDYSPMAGKVDFGKTADDYAKHRAGFPDSFFAALADHGLLQAGQRALDLGTGTGTVARGLAKAGLTVTGLDPANDMTELAKTMDAAAGVTVDYITAMAETTGFADQSFDLVTAGQCWHWFDRVAAASEAQRILKPGGHLVIAHYDWLPLPGNLVEATEALIVTHSPNWRGGGMNGIHGRWISDLRLGGFVDVESFSHDDPAIYSHEAWRGRIRASAGIAASLSQDQVAAFDAEHATMLAEKFPQNPLVAEHCVFVAYGRTPKPEPRSS